MGTNIADALKDADRVCKKQKTCANKTQEQLDYLISSISTTRSRLLNPTESNVKGNALVAELHRQVDNCGVVKEISDHTKDLHSAVSKLGKVIEATR